MQYNEPIGQLKKLGDMNWEPYKKTIMKYEGGPVPLEREIITPESLAASNKLKLVYRNAKERGL